MKKTILFLFLLSMGLFGSLEAIASGGYTHTHTTPMGPFDTQEECMAARGSGPNC